MVIPPVRGARSLLLGGLVVCAWVALLYAPSLRFGFVTDDFYFARPLTAGQMLSTFYGNWEPLGQGNAHYRPVVAVSFQLDYLLWGPRPRGYHLTNLLVMAVLGTVGWRALGRLLGDHRLALACALLWLAHPLSATAAAWTSQRTDSIMALWYLAALATLLAEPFGKRELAGFLCCGLLALGSKEMAATLAPMAALVAWAGGKATRDENGRRRLLAILVLAGLTGAYLLAWAWLFPSKTRLVVSGLARTLPNLLLPVWVPMSYARAGAGDIGWWPLGLVAVSLAALWVLIRRLRPELVRLYLLALAWPLLTLPPVFGLRDPDIFRLGLLVCLAAPLALGALGRGAFGGRRTGAALAVVAALVVAAAYVPPARSTAQAWGPGGFAFASGNGWKLRDPVWESRLTPEMRRLFRRQARWYMSGPPASPGESPP